MANRHIAFLFVMSHEDVRMSGEVVTDNDGGQVRFGVNSRSNPQALADGFYTMSKDDALVYAENVFVTKYWNRIDGDAVNNQRVANQFADLDFNSGNEAVFIMQRAANRFQEKPIVVDGKFGPSHSRLWAELLSLKEPAGGESKAEVLETYGTSNGWLDGQPAAVTRQVGKGRITYIGAWMDDIGMANAAKWMAEVSGVKQAFGPVPEGVEVSARYGARGTVFILINFSKTEQSVPLSAEMADVLSGGPKTSVTLPVYGVAVLESVSR